MIPGGLFGKIGAGHFQRVHSGWSDTLEKIEEKPD
jgi:hypothetical protein